ncbi:NAD-dependent epimerase/dehydratase family protein [Paenibacillus larvae]|uniref:NAD-dependent epimerase/dehydratase family protein n=1 Tax=Paenibacillus larvae TaxID=1464 RepID=UPI0023A9A19B|nr:NAD-dependent epimerase/dehydratase family protein [Paenibacillus larvae]MDE5168528.1 NAD-dependent epimerase/dehydratase family protein [Paenibacillus larvae subsp. larvae]
MKILVTGGAGFIGSHVVDAYIQEGYEVVVVDILSTGILLNVHPKAKFYQVDIRSKELNRVFDEERPDIVNHHAAQKSVPKSWEDPMLDADINILGLMNILQLSVEYKVQRIIFASSGGALSGNALSYPTSEQAFPSFQSPYAITKYISEKYIHLYAEIHRTTYVILRYANVYGARQIAEGECGVIPVFLHNLLTGQPSTLYTYDDMPRGTLRDYVYVKDVAKANVLALTEGQQTIVHIGSGQGVYTADLYELLQTVTGISLPLMIDKERQGDIKYSLLDCSKAYEELGWKPQTGLLEGLTQTVEYLFSGPREKEKQATAN